MCDYTEENVTSMDRLELVNLMLLRLDDPDIDSVRLETRGRRLLLQTFFAQIDLSEFDKCRE